MRISKNLYRALLAYALVKGAGRGVARALWRKSTGVELQAFNNTMKSLYSPLITEQLNSPSIVFTWTDTTLEPHGTETGK